MATTGKTNRNKVSNAEIASEKKRLEQMKKGSESTDKAKCAICNRHATLLCPYCKQYFCNMHINPTISMPHPIHWPNDNPRLVELYKKEWEKERAHICTPYTAERLAAVNETVKISHWGWRSVSDRRTVQSSEVRESQKINRHRLRLDGAILLKALVITIGIILLYMVGFLNPDRLQINLASLGSTAFAIYLVIVFFITMIYDFTTAHRKFATQELFGAIFSAISATMLVTFNLSSVNDIAVFAITIFLSLYAGYWIARRKKTIRIVQFFGVLFLLLMLIEGFGLTGNQNSILHSANSILGNSLTPAINVVGSTLRNASYSSGPIINGTWTTQLFQNISSVRGAQYNYCSNLSDFAAIRFNTMVQDYGISHYGYDQDFNSFYGGVYGTYFAEEVFYPSGNSPKNYVSVIQNEYPLHWELLTNNTYTYYGYHIQNGPSYTIYGPDGGYLQCPTTEIPGPNINISQYFAQYDCTVQEANETWQVLELASACP